MAEHNQQFDFPAQWANHGASWLTRRGPNVKPICFDAGGNICITNADFDRAHQCGLYPVYWVWPDQVAALAVATMWKPIATAPHDREVIVGNTLNVRTAQHMTAFEDGSTAWIIARGEGFGVLFDEPTHWMEKPPLPPRADGGKHG
jgi:hypothetical protein